MKGSLRARVERLEGASPKQLPKGCRSLREWLARLRNHRAMLSGITPTPDLWAQLASLEPLFPVGSDEAFRWSTDIHNRRIAEKMAELRARDWSAPTRPEVVHQTPKLVEKTKKQKADKPDRLAPYRDQRDTIIPEPE